LSRPSLTRCAAVAAFLAASSSFAGTPKSADRETLKQALLDVLGRSPLKGSRVGVEVESLDTGEVIFRQNEDDLLNPASNVKLFTAAAALVTLGPEYRFETEFLADGDASTGRVKTLWVRGKGDPSLNTERLYEIVSELKHLGLRDVGDIVLDDSYFDGDRNPPGYEQENTDRAYMAPTGALSFNLNSVGVYLRPTAPGHKAVVELEPASDFFIVENHAATSSRGRYRRFSVSSEPAGNRQRIVVRGTVSRDGGETSVWKKIDDPPLYFGESFKRMLEERGVKVHGAVKLGQAPQDARALYVAQSDTFDLILKRMDKMSSNFIAEQLMKTMGAVVKGAPGTTEHGVQVVEEFLEKEVGVPRGTFVMKNGSGLNDTNRFSANQVTQLLKYMYERFPLAPEYLSSMGIAGKDGTLRYRFENSEAAGRLRAKTGTLQNVSALSGYVQAVGGEKFAFSMMVNDYSGRLGQVVQGLDALATAVAASGSREGPDQAIAAMINQPKDVSPSDQALSRIRTYLALAKQSDRRNIDFLRTALRTEKDPAVRAVVAEAIYQSNRQDYFGARALLDSFAATDVVYGRLRSLAKELKVDVPGVGSVVELAAEGNQEAIARVLELGQSAASDQTAKDDLAQSLSEIARTAPDELINALRTAAPPERDATVALLALGLANTEADHPFWPSVHRMMGSSDGPTAAFAKGLEGDLSQAIAKLKAPAQSGQVQVATPATASPAMTVPASTKMPAPAGQKATADTRPPG
jgi:D-alanyl-D-alanine carboxypeptidase/D-alanyl-D-alanine-endopeptidase (penicillin-binding protein 4)